MKRSLQRHLSLALGAATLIAGLAAAAASFVLAYSDARDFQDDMLRQIAVLSSEQTSKAAMRDAYDAAISDPDSRVTLFHLPSATAPVWLNNDLTPGLHTLDTADGQMRVFAGSGLSRTIVAQPTEARDEIAINSALRTLIPLLILLPLLVWLIVSTVRRQLAPITRLAASLDEQSAHQPGQLQCDDLPEEIIPFVHAINRLLERVSRLISQQRRFIADASHELRSPLTALSVQVENLMHADTLQTMRERVLPLQDGIERARRLTEQLLSLARIQHETAPDSKINTSGINVSVMARELLAEYLPLATLKHIDLGLEETVPLSLRADHDALRLIVGNALENALKYTPEHGEVTLRLLCDPDNAIIEVIDNGPGIAASEHDKVFNAFYRLPGSAGSGSGLGLAIAREAAESLGGTASVHDRESGHGLVFRYRQPLSA